MSEEKKGILLAFGAYIIWGFLPLYWKMLGNVSSDEIIASRVIWSFVFTFVAVLIIGKWRQLVEDLKTLWENKKSLYSIILASFLISGNWLLFIWAVNSDHLVESSLGYYINPIMSVLLGIFFLKEKLSKTQTASVIIASTGVLILTMAYGRFPWVAFCLAISFAVYGLLKKQIKLDPLRALTIESFFVLPIAIAYYIYLFANDSALFLQLGFQSNVLLICTGIVSAVPLLLFANGAQRIPLYLVGFLQYIAPTLMLFIGVVLYGEKFGSIDLISFSLIWISLILFMGTKVVEYRKQRLALAK